MLAEAAYLVRKLPGGPAAVLDLVTRGVLEVDSRVDTARLASRTLINKYASVAMSLADACLVRMAEIHPRASIVTRDADFHIYRRSGRPLLRLVRPT